MVLSRLFRPRNGVGTVHTSPINKVDQTLLPCCALHYWMLDIDGFAGEWKDGELVSDWVRESRHVVFESISHRIPNAIARLSMNLDPQNYDLSCSW